MNRIVIVLALSMFFSNTVFAERNYPIRIMILSGVTATVGVGLTGASLWAGMDKDYHFKGETWKDVFYAGLAFDVTTLGLFFMAMLFACCEIGYTPIDQGDCLV